MVFNSLLFVGLFPLIAFFSWVLPLQYRRWLLLLFSYYFYMCWEPAFTFLLVFTTAVDFYAAQLISRSASSAGRRFLLSLSLSLNLGILFYFKYLHFIASAANQLMGENFFVTLQFILPIGISFYTFQSMSYVIDVYRKRLIPATHFPSYALFVSFFPQLVAGPIERAPDLIPQFVRRPLVSSVQIQSGLRLILAGYFRKIVVADQLAPFVQAVFDNKVGYGGFEALIATYFFAFQIYCDFSGYSEIALGCAKVMGFDLTRNFRQPYLSTSLKDFWVRWHVTLSSWFKDYVYIPLGGNRSGRPRWALTVLIVFTLSGLWHGANWTFMLWGLLNGVFLVFESALRELWRQRNQEENPVSRGWMKLMQSILTFHAVLLGWIFFRAPSLSDALAKIRDIFIWLKGQESFSFESLLLPVASILCVLLMDLLRERGHAVLDEAAGPRFFRWCYYVVALWSIFFSLAGHYEQNNPFIYFAF